MLQIARAQAFWGLNVPCCDSMLRTAMVSDTWTVVVMAASEKVLQEIHKINGEMYGATADDITRRVRLGCCHEACSRARNPVSCTDYRPGRELAV
jgi:hypothetical protein